MRAAAQLLNALGVLPEHEAYMEQHAHTMMNKVHGTAPEPQEESMNNFKQFFEQTTPANMEDPASKHLTDKDLADIERHIDKLEWEDIRHLYDEQEHQEMEEELDLDEALTAAQRMKKRFDFMKTKAKREIAAKIARKRISTQGKLKKKSIVHARKLIMQKLLKGRDKGSLSAAEKDRIEAIVHKAKGAVIRISNKLMPKIRELEQKRLKHRQHVREDWAEVGDTEEISYHTTVNDTAPVGMHAGVERARFHLNGNKELVQSDPRDEIDQIKHMRKIKNFRKMEV
jgi:hypothetical protein